MAKLARNGRKVVPIIDPGVKLDKSYDVTGAAAGRWLSA